MAEPRVIPRKHIDIILRDEEHRVYSLAAYDLKRLVQSIESLIPAVLKQASNLPKLDWRTRKGKLPVASLDILHQFLDYVIDYPLGLLEAASGLPHKFFDATDRANCLSIDELIELGKVVIEVNGLDFVWKKLRGWWEANQRSAARRQSALSVRPLDASPMEVPSIGLNASTPTISSGGFMARLFGKK